LSNEGFTYLLQNGKEDTIHIDAVLDYNEDPDFMKEIRLHKMTVKAIELFKKKKITKAELRRRMDCSKVQLDRLLDTAFYGKTTDQMIKLLKALDCEVEILFKKAS